MEKREELKPKPACEPLAAHLGQEGVPGNPGRLRLWEIDNYFKCPVVGLCLSLSEQKSIIKKAGLPNSSRSPFELHEILVSSSDEKGILAQRADHLLHRKFAGETKRLSGLDERAFMHEWETAFVSGDYAGAFWAAVTRADLSTGARRTIFGSVHMAMHENAAQVARLTRLSAFHEQKAAAMEQKAREERKARKGLGREISALQKSRVVLERQLSEARRALDRMNQGIGMMQTQGREEGLEKENALLRAEETMLLRRVAESEGRAAGLMEENKKLSLELHQQKELNARFQEEVRALAGDLITQNECNASCPSFDLCKRRVLMVGGLTKMEALYRQMVEDCGGIFEYHDGYMKSGTKNLENCLRRADLVLCPVNCNSHAACSLVKNLGKKHNKPVRILASSSLSAIAQALSGKGGIHVSGN